MKIDHIIPPFILTLYLRFFKKSPWRNEYPDWSTAKHDSTGYDEKKILDKVLNSTLLVLSGEAQYERDSILFFEQKFEFDLVSLIQYSMSLPKSTKKIIDFGGSLGSMYFQNKKLLPPNISWNIVEQEHFVSVGILNIDDENLIFHVNLNDAMQNGVPDCIILSSVFQYIDDPYSLLEELNQTNAKTILFYNTPFSYSDKEIICIQTVDKKIYDQSYPCRFMPRETVENSLSNYNLYLQNFSDITIYHKANPIPYQALLFKRKDL